MAMGDDARDFEDTMGDFLLAEIALRSLAAESWEDGDTDRHCNVEQACTFHEV